MIAGARFTAHNTIHACVLQPSRGRIVQQDMVDPQARVSGPSLAKILPEGPGRRIAWKSLPDGVRPSLVQQFGEGRPARRLKERVFLPGPAAVDVRLGRHDVIVARQNDRRIKVDQTPGVTVQAVEPGQLVIELGTGLRIAVRQVEAADQHPIDCGLDVSALFVGEVARQTSAGQDGRTAAAQDRHAVPAVLAAPDGMVTRLADRSLRKLLIARLQLLKADDVGPGRLQPDQQSGEPAVDAVDVEGRDAQRRPSGDPLCRDRIAGGEGFLDAFVDQRLLSIFSLGDMRG